MGSKTNGNKLLELLLLLFPFPLGIPLLSFLLAGLLITIYIYLIPKGGVFYFEKLFLAGGISYELSHSLAIKLSLGIPAILWSAILQFFAQREKNASRQTLLKIGALILVIIGTLFLLLAVGELQFIWAGKVTTRG